MDFVMVIVLRSARLSKGRSRYPFTRRNVRSAVQSAEAHHRNTHLSVALGLDACRFGLCVMFTTATALITTLGKALYENRLEERLKLLTQPKLLIIDEIGYIPIDRQGANLLFQLVSRRYERGAILLTSNQSLGTWGEVFSDAVVAGAILDRLLHHATTINIKGDSYRLREKRKAGLMHSRSCLTPRPERPPGGEFETNTDGEVHASIDSG